MYYNMCIMNVAYQDAPHGRISQKYVDDIEKAAVRSFLKHNTLADRRLDAPYIEERLRELLTFYDDVEKNGL